MAGNMALAQNQLAYDTQQVGTGFMIILFILFDRIGDVKKVSIYPDDMLNVKLSIERKKGIITSHFASQLTIKSFLSKNMTIDRA
jgi:hypothetical protein